MKFAWRRHTRHGEKKKQRPHGALERDVVAELFRAPFIDVFGIQIFKLVDPLYRDSEWQETAG